MHERNFKANTNDWSRRRFLETMGASVPTLKLMLKGAHAGAGQAATSDMKFDSKKFTPIDLGRCFTASPSSFGARERAKGLGGDSARDGLVRVPTGDQDFRGIPFRLGPEGVEKRSWIVLSALPNSWAASSLDIPLQQKASFICLASFCEWDKNEEPPPGDDVAERIGQQLAEAIFVYEGGSEKGLPIRRRFEVNAPSIPWGHLCFAALSHRQDSPRKPTDSLRQGTDWGDLQTAVQDNSFGEESLGTLWVCALGNPDPNRMLQALRLRAAADDPLMICGLTLFHGRENPLRFERLCLYRIALPEPTAEEAGRWKAEVDLGVIARTYTLSDFDPETWLQAPDAGLGEHAKPVRGGRHLFVEVTASPDATLVLADVKAGARYEFDLGQAVPGRELEARSGNTRIEILEHEKVWLHGQVTDAATHRPTPVRLAFRSKDGRYIPPYGHRREINDGWFQDYGADLKLMDSSFAYVDGSFQIELPVDEVFVEITKGFEYAPVRKMLKIEAGQRELKLEISRFTDLRSKGWVTADTHVHFLSPSTAVLEGQAEGLNLINLLAAQWGDLFTNVGDFSYGSLTSHDGEMMVQVSTENRQHLLGHLGLLGVRDAPVFPMSASGPGESYLGDPLWSSLAEWTDVCRERKGLAVAVHFPYPTAELAADIVLGKIEAVELYPYTQHFNALQFLDWYRYLNCGYRLPAVGGTDKMGAYMPVGANRTYAHLGEVEFNFSNWAKAVRQGNTFSTTGPLILFQADGHAPGLEITLGRGGGTVEVGAEAKSFAPIHRLEVVLNGKVVASRVEDAGARELKLNEKVKVQGPGWLAARCASRLGPTTAWQFAITAHTSPVYVRVPGQELFSAAGATYFLTLIEGTQTWVENLATRPDPERMEKVRKMLDEARDRLHRRMHEHEVAHTASTE
jgi:hypothetical protein